MWTKLLVEYGTLLRLMLADSGPKYNLTFRLLIIQKRVTYGLQTSTLVQQQERKELY